MVIVDEDLWEWIVVVVVDGWPRPSPLQQAVQVHLAVRSLVDGMVVL